MKTKYEPVVFEDSQGNPISNDPLWLAQQRLAQAGVELPEDNSAELEAQLNQKNEEIESLRAALAAKEAEEASDLEPDDEAPKADVDDDGNRTYKELDSRGLKALAGEREVDISGLKTVGEVRKALIDADAAAKA